MAANTKSLECPQCGAPTVVRETRSVERGVVRRRRSCSNGHDSLSWEFAEARLVRKRDGRLVVFDADKLRQAVFKAIRGLDPVPPIEPIIVAATEAMSTSPERTGDAISTIEIGNIVLEGLRIADSSGVAALRFGSVFLRDRHFPDAHALLEAIENPDVVSLHVLKRRRSSYRQNPDDSRVLIEPFNYRKLRASIAKALRKTDFENKVEEVLTKVVRQAELESEPAWVESRVVRRDIPAARIGQLVLEQLRDMAWVPYARYLSVFDPPQFLRESGKTEVPT
jgi:transcriptional regulator NrdR family protein